VFFDIDGTLLNDEKELNKTTIEGIQKLKENGVIVAIATGRAPFMIQDLCKQLDISTYVTFNGQYVVHEGKEIYRNPLDVSLLNELRMKANEHEHPMVFMDHKKMKADIETHHHIEKSFSSLKMSPPTYDPTYHEGRDIYQSLIFYDRKDDEKFLYDQHFQDLQFIRWHHYSVDILPKGGSKAEGIKKLLEIINIEREHSFAFGDALNDLEMVEYVGTGVAMGNAMVEVKEKADLITKHTNDDGIYHGLKILKLI
jgi:Cof subfamily protein (haloacid dehalogenase superfamily)